MSTMQAAVIHRFGPPEVVQIETVPKPIPKANQVLIRVHASSLSIADYRLRSKDLPGGFAVAAPFMLGFFGPRRKVLGADLTGVVESVGSTVTKFAAGDRVIASTGMSGG